jgi:1-deoxy-D-xylulose-5-phosphate synthase
MRPIVDVYSTFLQRSFDQIFQEVALQNLPVVFMMDRAGLAGPDGPTHHGVFDIGFLRLFPNMVVMAPGDAGEIAAMLDFSLRQNSPCAIRYPKAMAFQIQREPAPVELGRAEVLQRGRDCTIVCCGALLAQCAQAAEMLRQAGLDVGLINARFVKPLDRRTILRAVRESSLVATVEEAAMAGGFGSAVLEAVADEGLCASRVLRLGIPDFFVEHGERRELLADLGLDAEGIVRKCRDMMAPDAALVSAKAGRGAQWDASES